MGKAIAVKPLDVMERKRYRHIKDEVQQNLPSFIVVGNLLAEAQRDKLFREDYKTFELFVEGEFGLKRTRAYDLINSAIVSQQVSENSDTPAPKESHAEALAKCPPEQRKEVWKEAVATAPNGKVTAKHVTKVADVINRRNIPMNNAAAFHHQLAEDEDDEGFEPDAIGSGAVIDSHAVPDEEVEAEPETPPAPVSYFKRFREIWDEADDTARCVIRDFVNRKPGDDE